MRVIDSSFNDYCQWLSQEYLNICTGLDVLEIGPGPGHHSQLIINNDPKYFEVIEPNTELTSTLKNIYGIDSVVAHDALVVLSKPRRFDLVVCFGVLYHLHNPLHLLELIVNNCNPTYIMLDCVVDPKNLYFQKEPINEHGCLFVEPGWKSSGYVLTAIPYDIVDQSLKNMGYNLVKSNMLNVTDNFTKCNSWLALWTKNDSTNNF